MIGLLDRRFPSPLRYPGGKGKVANYIKLLFLHNDLLGSEYVEVFAGGASVALSLLFEEYAAKIHINDLNRSIFCFWDAVLNNTPALCERIRNARVDMDEWHRQRAIQFSNCPDPLDLAYSTFFLNRTNRSGIISAGVIGGQRQEGKWKLDARFNSRELVRRIEKIAEYRSRITLTNHDAAVYLRDTLPSLPAHSFVYLDPPYFEKAGGLYEHVYQRRDHEQIAGLVGGIQQPWLISYDAHPEILRLYSEFRSLIYGLSYSAADRYRGAEVMLFSRGIEQPPTPSPANIPFSLVDEVRRRIPIAGAKQTIREK